MNRVSSVSPVVKGARMATSARLLKGPNASFPEPLTIPNVESAVSFELPLYSPEEKDTGEETLEVEASQILAEAEHQAQQIIANARNAALQIENQAREAGLSEARSIIEKQLQLEVADLRSQLVRSLDELEQLYAVIATRVEKDLVRLAIEIARKIVNRTVTTDPDVTITLARVALERLHPRAVATVRINPEDFDWVSEHKQQLGNYCTIELVADPSIARGGCLVQSEHGDVDARIDQQFAAVERGFFEA